ncbi:hypothetical protein C8R46DRAFT_1048659 [Mycena filopes]|nr:hypothetical protein C8R46DRAFT_1048659 [Mycena filopes]
MIALEVCVAKLHLRRGRYSPSALLRNWLRAKIEPPMYMCLAAANFLNGKLSSSEPRSKSKTAARTYQAPPRDGDLWTQSSRRRCAAPPRAKKTESAGGASITKLCVSRRGVPAGGQNILKKLRR